MVVAHADDETLWGGGLILRHPGDWTVMCCSVPVADPIRAERFVVACERLGARPVLYAAPDRYGVPLALDVALDGFDTVVTHGREGEYGHPHHVQVSAYVRARARCPVITFGYDAGEALRLTEAEQAAKLRALQAYDHELVYDGVLMPKWAALLQRYGRHWLERELFHG